MKLADSWTHPLPGFGGKYGTPSWAGYVHLQIRTPEGRKDRHIGDDYNGPDGGNTDIGMPVVFAARGWVEKTIPWDGSYGFGHHVFVKHFLPDWLKKELRERYGITTDILYSHYAHLRNYICKEGVWYNKGTILGFVGESGTKRGHLHHDIRRPTGLGYESYPSFRSVDWIKEHYLSPFPFIEDHKSAPLPTSTLTTTTPAPTTPVPTTSAPTTPAPTTEAPTTQTSSSSSSSSSTSSTSTTSQTTPPMPPPPLPKPKPHWFIRFIIWILERLGVKNYGTSNI